MSLQTRLAALITAIGTDVKSLMDSRIEVYTFAVPGAITGTYTGKSRIYLEGSYAVDTIRAAVGTASTSGAVTVDVNKNGTTLYTTQTARPIIAQGAFSANGNSPAVTTFVAGDYLTVDIDTFGASATDLTVTVRLRRTF